jgi:pantoate--beta-alanine ligase
MKIISNLSEAFQFFEAIRIEKNVGFVPTMGALHQGHISLVEKSLRESELTVVSIFVNPRQFNDKSDFENYPTNQQLDLDMLEKVGCDVVFIPDNTQMYANYNGYAMDFEGLDSMYEGEFRPGHFQGVVDVVFRLFDIVKPHKAFFGQKDFQQLAIIKKMTNHAGLEIEILSCPIIREESGLAMSSRNERLSSNQRINAASIYSEMKSVANSIKIGDNTEQWANHFVKNIEKVEDLKAEYCVFCNPNSLEKLDEVLSNSVIVMCVAVWCGKVRLIDNIILEF